jgi:hypothetical protein
MPKAGTPRKKPDTINRADGFRRTGRYLTWRRPRRRGPLKTQSSGGLPKPSFAAAKKLLRRPLQDMRIIDSSPSQPPSVAASGGAGDRDSSAPGDVPDVSAEFRSEFAALLAFYAARISAARRSFSGSVAAAIVQALMNEQAVALRALTDRRHAATQKQRDEKPERPTGNVQRKADDPRPS